MELPAFAAVTLPGGEVSAFTLRLRLEEAESWTSHSGKELIALRFGVVQQPEFGPVFDNLVLLPDNKFTVERISELFYAMRIPMVPGTAWAVEDLCGRLLEKRRYVLALLIDEDFRGGRGGWRVRRYSRSKR